MLIAFEMAYRQLQNTGILKLFSQIVQRLRKHYGVRLILFNCLFDFGGQVFFSMLWQYVIMLLIWLFAETGFSKMHKKAIVDVFCSNNVYTTTFLIAIVEQVDVGVDSLA